MFQASFPRSVNRRCLGVFKSSTGNAVPPAVSAASSIAWLSCAVLSELKPTRSTLAMLGETWRRAKTRLQKAKASLSSVIASIVLPVRRYSCGSRFQGGACSN